MPFDIFLIKLFFFESLKFADKDGDGYIEPFNVNPDEKNLGGDGSPVDLANTEVSQETHYYPFGMTMEGEWQNIVNGPENKYLYNGKELNSDFGLDWSDYGARWYDASIGRWNSVDPLAEMIPKHSPYAYTFNNPIAFNNPSGIMGESPHDAADSNFWTCFTIRVYIVTKKPINIFMLSTCKPLIFFSKTKTTKVILLSSDSLIMNRNTPHLKM